MLDLESIEADTKTVGGDTSYVVGLANEMITLQGNIKKAEELVKDMKDKLSIIQNEAIPEALDAIGMKEFTLTTGEKIEVQPLIRASLPSQGAIEKASDEDRPMLEKRLADGLAYIRSQEAGSLIKNILKLDVDKGKDNLVGEIIEIADRLGIPHLREESIHNQTLNKWIREKISEGKNVPEDTFSIFNGRIAVVAKAKKK